MPINVVYSSPIKVQKGRMLLADIELLKKKEFHRRRTVRLQQVRQQSKEIANEVRERCKEEKRKQLLLYKFGEKKYLRDHRVKKLTNLQQQYENCLIDFGASHREAARQPDAVAILNSEQCQSRIKAQRRGHIAEEALRSKMIADCEKQRQVEEHRNYVRGIEALRSAVISALPTSRKKASPKKWWTEKRPLHELNQRSPNSKASTSPTRSSARDENVPPCIPPLSGLKSISELSFSPLDENISSVLHSGRSLKSASSAKRRDEVCGEERLPVAKSPEKTRSVVDRQCQILQRSAVEAKLKELRDQINTQGAVSVVPDNVQPKRQQQRNILHLCSKRIPSSDRSPASGRSPHEVGFVRNDEHVAERISSMKGDGHKKSARENRRGGGDQRRVQFVERNIFEEKDQNVPGVFSKMGSGSEQSEYRNYNASRYRTELSDDYFNSLRGIISLDGSSRGLGLRSMSEPNILTDSENVCPNYLNQTHTRQMLRTQWTSTSALNGYGPSVPGDTYHPANYFRIGDELQDIQKNKLQQDSRYPPKQSHTVASSDDHFRQILSSPHSFPHSSPHSSPGSSPEGFRRVSQQKKISQQLDGKAGKAEGCSDDSEHHSENAPELVASQKLPDSTELSNRDGVCSLGKDKHKENRKPIPSSRNRQSNLEPEGLHSERPLDKPASGRRTLIETSGHTEEAESNLPSAQSQSCKKSERRQLVEKHYSTERADDNLYSEKRPSFETTRQHVEVAEEDSFPTGSTSKSPLWLQEAIHHTESQTSISDSATLPHVRCYTSNEKGRIVRVLKRAQVASLLDVVTEVEEEEDEEGEGLVATLDKSTQAEESSGTQTARVRLYDHSNRFQREYEQPQLVERVPASAVPTDAHSEAAQEREKVAVAVQAGSSVCLQTQSRSQRRCREAMRRQCLERELEGLLGSLGPLARKERVSRAGIAAAAPASVALHLDDKRRKESVSVRQKNMDTAFEGIYHSSGSRETGPAVKNTEHEADTPASASVSMDSPLRLNVGVCDPGQPCQKTAGAAAAGAAAAGAAAAGSTAPTAEPPSSATDLQALECLLERVRAQRVALLQQLPLPPLTAKRPAESDLSLDTSGSSLGDSDPSNRVKAPDGKKQPSKPEKSDVKSSYKKQVGGKYVKTCKKDGQRQESERLRPQRQEQGKSEDKQGRRDEPPSQSSENGSVGDNTEANIPPSTKVSEYDIDVSLTRIKHGAGESSSQAGAVQSHKEMKIKVHVQGRKKSAQPEGRRKAGPCKRRCRKDVVEGVGRRTEVVCNLRPGVQPVITIQDLDGEAVTEEQPGVYQIWQDKLMGPPFPEESSSTAYLSPPDQLVAEPHSVPCFQSQPPSSCVKHYISRLLVMSKASLDALNLSSSDVSVPSDILEHPSNIRQCPHHGQQRRQQRSVAVCVTPNSLTREMSQQSPVPAAPVVPTYSPPHRQATAQDKPHPKYSNIEYRSFPLAFPTSKVASKRTEGSVETQSPLAHTSPQGHDTTQYKPHPGFANTEYRTVPSDTQPVSLSRVIDSPEYRAVMDAAGEAQPTVDVWSPQEDEIPAEECDPACRGPQYYLQSTEASPAAGEDYREWKIDNLHLADMSDRCAKRISDLTKMIENLRNEKRKILEIEITHETPSISETRSPPPRQRLVSPPSGRAISPQPLGVPQSPLLSSPMQAQSTPSGIPPLRELTAQVSPPAPKSPISKIMPYPKEIAITVAVLPARSPELPTPPLSVPTSPPPRAHKPPPHIFPHPSAPTWQSPGPSMSPPRQTRSPPPPVLFHTNDLLIPVATYATPVQAAAAPLYLPRAYLEDPPVPPDVPPLCLPADLTSTPRRPCPPPSLPLGRAGAMWQKPHELSTIVEVDSVLSVPDEAPSQGNATDMGKVVIDKSSAGAEQRITSMIIKMQEVLDGVASEEQKSPSEMQQSDSLTCPCPKQNNDLNENDDDDDDDTPDIMEELLTRGVMTSPFGWMKRDSEQPRTNWEISEQRRCCECSPVSGGSEHCCAQKSSQSSEHAVFCPTHVATTLHDSERSGAAEHSSSSLYSSPDDLEGMFQRLGLGWASAMLRKTQERMAMSSSSSDNSHGPWPASGGRVRPLSQAVSSLDGSQNTSSNDIWCQSTPSPCDARHENNLFMTDM